MSNKILIKRTNNPSNDPTSLEPGELAVNLGTNPPNLYVGDGTNVLNLSSVAYTSNDLSSGSSDVHRNGSFWIDPTDVGSEKIYFRANNQWNQIPTNHPKRVENSWTNVIGETTFDFNHDVDMLDVYLNGSKLTKTIEYTSDGSSFVLLQPISSDDDILYACSWM